MINSITINGVKVDCLEDSETYCINGAIQLSADEIHSLLSALGMLSFDMTGYTLPEVAGDTEAPAP